MNPWPRSATRRLKLLILSLLVSAALFAAVGGFGAADPFSGTWRAVDPADGSTLTLMLTRVGSQWNVELQDTSATTSCGGASARGTGTATADGNLLTLHLAKIVCASGKEIGAADIQLKYDPSARTLTDSSGAVYRQAATQVRIALSATSTVKWHESVPEGLVKVTGRVSIASRLSIRLQGLRSTRIVAARTISVATAGPFAVSIRLPRTVLPGKYRVSATVGSPTGIAPARAYIVIPTPPEGVVLAAFASLRRGGPAVISVSESVTELWARFRFVARPSVSRVAAYWIPPSGKRESVVVKPYSQTVDTFVSSSGPLQRGRWQAVLVAAGRVIKRVSVQLG